MLKSLYPILLPLSRRKMINCCLQFCCAFRLPSPMGKVAARRADGRGLLVPFFEKEQENSIVANLSRPRFARPPSPKGRARTPQTIQRTSPGSSGEVLCRFICSPAGFPCARIGSRGAWDPPLPREPAFFPLLSWRFTPGSVFPGYEKPCSFRKKASAGTAPSQPGVSPARRDFPATHQRRYAPFSFPECIIVTRETLHFPEPMVYL